MFWKKKKQIQKPQRFLKLIVPEIGVWSVLEKSYPAYKDESMEEAKRLAFYEDLEPLRDLMRTIEQKQDLILDHLNLEYKPETKKKEPAKLVEKLVLSSNIRNISELTTIAGGICPHAASSVPEGKPKKKQGRPKKKK